MTSFQPILFTAVQTAKALTRGGGPGLSPEPDQINYYDVA